MCPKYRYLIGIITLLGAVANLRFLCFETVGACKEWAEAIKSLERASHSSRIINNSIVLQLVVHGLSPIIHQSLAFCCSFQFAMQSASKFACKVHPKS
jgi:hypothetical protein